jgi:3-isopropylmalate/(R)-2-methylmalate dehydratase small subunit
MDFRYEGRAWVVGDDVPNDEGIMPLRMVRQQVYDPAELAKAAFEQVDAKFAPEAKARDVVVAGRNFGYGNPHIQGFLALKGIGVGIVAESMSRGPMRACVNAGVPVMVIPGVSALARPGDRIRADFASGLVENLTTGLWIRGEPMAPVMLEIVAAGGGIEHMKQRLATPA